MTRFCYPQIRPCKQQNGFSLVMGSFQVSKISPAARLRKQPFPRRVTPYYHWLRYFRIVCLPLEDVRLDQEQLQEFATFWHCTISHFLSNQVRRLLIMSVFSSQVFSNLLSNDKTWSPNKQASCP